MKKLILILTVVSYNIAFISCAHKRTDNSENKSKEQTSIKSTTTMDTATFGAGCFWCVEAQFQLLDSVMSVTSGFSGGTVKNPAYREVCNGTTGHAEVCNIAYDPSKISYDELLAA